jgi:hypothetical protein
VVCSVAVGVFLPFGVLVGFGVFVAFGSVVGVNVGGNVAVFVGGMNVADAVEVGAVVGVSVLVG